MGIKKQKSSDYLDLCRLFKGMIAGAIASTLHAKSLHAQPIVPNTDGTNTQVTSPDGSRFEITGGTQAGSNLFHSFQRFGLDADQIAQFLSQPDIVNILSRINGGNPSVIHGLVQVTGSSANLFLINPSGIIFGPNARLDVPGSFTATTATGIGFTNNSLFATVGTPNYAELVGAPTLFQFAIAQPGSILNTGQLVVGAGQNLNFLAGTIVNTGTLTAGGQLTLTTVPGSSLVRLSQPESLLSLDIQPIASPGNPTAPLLPQLLTGSGLTSHALSLAVNPDGSVSLSGSGVGVNPGDVVVAQPGSSLSGGSVNLQAFGNLTLAETQMTSQGDLNLLANQQVYVRDSLQHPFLALADGNLTIQGNQNIDIFALNHQPIDAFQSGGNLSLISDGIISGDAHFTSRGRFVIRSLSGGLATFQSLYDPIISANSDVDVAANYSGTSLLVEATGNIRFQGNITITGPDTLLSTPGPDTALLNSSSALILRSGQATLSYAIGNYSGSSTPPSFSTGPVPAGITVVGNITLNPIAVGNAIVNLTAATGDITVGNTSSSGGAIFLNSAGHINATNRTLSSGFPSAALANTGSITLIATQNITVGSITTASSAGNGSNSANTGSILVSTSGGNFAASNFVSTASQVTGGPLTIGNTGNAGFISINATTGNISLNAAVSSSTATIIGNAANAGAVSLNAGGNISLNNALGSSARSTTGNAGNGGAIALIAGGNVTTRSISTFSLANSGNASNAGSVTIQANVSSGLFNTNNQNINAFSQINSNGSTGCGGSITVTAGTINLGTGNLTSYANRAGAGAGVAQNGGNVTLTATNNIIVANVLAESRTTTSTPTGNAGSGGAIRLNTTNANWVVTGNLSAFSQTNNGNSGNGGSVTIVAAGNGTLSQALTFAQTSTGNAGSSGPIHITTGANLTATGILNATSGVNGTGCSANGGTISLNAAGTLTLNNVDGRSQVLTAGNSGNGGSIVLNGSQVISTGYLSVPAEVIGTGNSGNGGSIVVNTSGNASGFTFVNAQSQVAAGVGNAGNGGNITFNTGGNLTLPTVDIYSFSNTGNAGNGGTLTITTSNGNVTTQSIRAYVYTGIGNVGNGGAVGINVSNGNFSATLIDTDAAPQLYGGTPNAANGGSVHVTAGSITISATVRSGISIDAAGLGGGNVTLNATNGNVNLAAGIATVATSTIANSRNGGSIQLNASQGINVGALQTFSQSTVGNTGNGGAVVVQAGNSANLQNILTYANTGNGGSIQVLSTNGAINGTGGLWNTSSTNANAGSLGLLAPTNTTGAITLATISSVGAANSGALALQAGGLVQQAPGTSIDITGNASFNTTLPSAGDVLLNNSFTGNTVLGNGNIGGSLTVTATGNITQALGTNLNVAGTTTLTSGGNTVLTGAANALPDVLIIDGTGNVTIDRLGPVTLATRNVSGNLSVTSRAIGTGYSGTAINGSAINLNSNTNQFRGNISLATATNGNFGPAVGTASINQAGVQNVAGSTILNASVGGNITLLLGNNFTNVNLVTANIVNLNSTNALNLATTTVGQINATATGNLATASLNAPRGINLTSLTGNLVASGNLSSRNGINSAGAVILTAIAGNLSTGNIEAIALNTGGNAGNGGGITVTAFGNLTVGQLNSSSAALTGNTGNAGAISLTSGANVTTASLTSRTIANTGNAGNAGGISVQANGTFTTNNQNLQATTRSNVSGSIGSGGAVTIQANAINLGSGAILTSASRGGLVAGNTGSGGAVNLNATTGNLQVGGIQTFTNLLNGNAGNGGSITLGSPGNITTGDLNSRSQADDNLLVTLGRAGNGGAVQITSGANLNTGSIITFSQAWIGNVGNGGEIRLNSANNLTIGTLDADSQVNVLGNARNGGSITIVSGGTLTAGDISADSQSTTGNAANAGSVSLNSNGNLTVGAIEVDSQVILLGSVGNAGAISLNSTGNATTNFILANSLTAAGIAGNGGSLTVNAGGGFNTSGQSVATYSRSNTSGSAGSGGDVLLTASSINLGSGVINASSSRDGLGTGNAGAGGRIRLNATASNLTIGNLSTFATSNAGNSGNGGSIQLVSGTGAINTGAANLNSSASNANAGAIDLTAATSVTLGNLTGNGSTGSQPLSIVAGNLISQVAGSTINISGNATFNTSSFIGAGNVSLTNTLATAFGDTNIGNNLSLNSAGNVTSPGRLNVAGNALIISAATVLVPDGDDQIGSFSSNSNNGTNIVITRVGQVTLGTTDILPDPVVGNLTVNSYAQGTGFTPVGNGAAINLSGATNRFGGVVSVITDFNSTSTPLTATPGINQAVAVNMNNVNGLATFNVVFSASNSTAVGNIVLNDPANQFPTVQVSGINVSLRDMDNLNVANTSLAGQFNAVAGGNLTTVNLNAIGGINLNSTAGNINTTGGLLNTSNGANSAGAVSLVAGAGNISTGNIQAIALNPAGNSGHGGKISLNAGGNLVIGSLQAYANATNGNAGNGGTVTLNGTGVTITAIDSSSEATNGNASHAGTVIVTATNNLSSGAVNARSVTSNGNTGNGGPILLTSGANLTTTGSLRTNAFAPGGGNAGNAGGINITAAANLSMVGVFALSETSNGQAGNGGAINLTSTAGNITDSGQVGARSIGSTGAGNAGAVTISAANGSVSLGNGLNVRSEATTSGNAGNAGAVTITANQNVTIDNVFFVRSNANNGNAGSGSTIVITANTGNVAVNTDIAAFAQSTAGNAAQGGAVTITANGNLTTLSIQTTAQGAGSTGNSGSINLTSGLGAVNTTGGNLNSSSSSAGAGSVTLTANNGPVTIGNLAAIGNANSGHVTVTASGDIRQANGTTANISGITLLNSTSGNVTLTEANDFTTVSVTRSHGVNLNDINALNLAASNISGNLTVTTGGNLTGTGGINVAGSTTLNGGGSNITLNAANNFNTVNVVSANNLQLNDVNALNLIANLTGNLNAAAGGFLSTGNLTAPAGITLNSSGGAIDTTAGNLNTSATNAGAITLLAPTGTVTVGNLTAVGGAGSQPLSITAGNLISQVAGTHINLTGAASFDTTAFNGAGGVNLTNAQATAWGNSNIGGNLTLSSIGNVTSPGRLNVAGLAVINSAAAVLVPDADDQILNLTISSNNGSDVVISRVGVVDLGSATNPIPNPIVGTLQVNSYAQGTSFSPVGNTTAIQLTSANNRLGGAVTVQTQFNSTATTVNTTPGIVQSVPVNMTGSGSIASLNAVFSASNSTAAGDITLSDPTNQLGTLQITGINVTLNENGPMLLSNGLVTGNLSLTANGTITQSGPLTVAGSTTLDSANNSITLDAANNFNTVSIVRGDNVILNDSNALGLEASNISGNFTVFTGGDLTGNGAINVAGTTTLNGVGSNIILNSTNRFNGAISVTSGNNVTVRDRETLTWAASNISGNLIVFTNSDLMASAPLNVAGTAIFDANGSNIMLDAAHNFNTVSIVSGRNVNIRDRDALTLGATNISGNFNVTTAATLNQSGALNVTGPTLLDAGSGNIALTDPNNNFNDVAILNATNVSLRDINNLNLGNANVSGNLTVLAGAALNTTGTLIVGNTSLTAGPIFIGAAITSSGNLTVVNGGNLTIDGAAFLNASGNISQTGVGLVFVEGTLNAAGVGINSAIALTGETTITTTGAVNLNSAVDGNANLIVNTTLGNVTFNGPLGTTTALGAVVINTAGATIFNQGVNAQSVTTDSPGTLILGGNITTTGAAGQNFGESTTLSGNITLESRNGPIVFGNALNGNQTLTLEAGLGNITFNAAIGTSTPLNALQINSANNVSTTTVQVGQLQITSNGSVDLGGPVALYNAGGMTVTATDITANAPITAPLGPVSLNARGSVNGRDIQAPAGITLTGNLVSAGFLNSSSSLAGGLITVIGPNGVTLFAVNSQGGSGTGGSVNLTTSKLIQITGTFVDQTGVVASVSTVGTTGGGSITIRHGGGAQRINFRVGDLSVLGTRGAITSGGFTILPPQSFPNSFTLGNIQIITDDYFQLELADLVDTTRRLSAERLPVNPFNVEGPLLCQDRPTPMSPGAEDRLPVCRPDPLTPQTTRQPENHQGMSPKYRNPT